MQRVFAGDVQGCADELDDLVARAHAEIGSEFELWLVGDLVNRGPASLRALRAARALLDAGRARIVLGNHELALLRVALGLRTLRAGDTFRDVLESGGDEIDWLRTLPIVATGRVGGSRFAMLHASAPPGVDLETLERDATRVSERLAASRGEAARLLAAERERDADADLLARVTRCRSIDARGRWSSREPARAGDAWHARWRAESPRFSIVYGHWATQGLHVERGLRGLDTGCVYHGVHGDRFLTAWLPSDGDRDAFATPDARFWRVPARARYLQDER